MRAFLVNLTLLFPMHTWEILTHIALSAPYLALWKAKCWLRRPQIYVGDGVLLTRTLFGHWIYVDGADVNLSPNLLIRGYWEVDLTRFLLRLRRPVGRPRPPCQ